MGTNYYAYKIYPTDPQHIGKNSWGWVFHFQATSTIKSVSQMKDYLKDKVIYNEYEEQVSHEEFWKIVEETRNPMPNGQPKYILTDGTHEPFYTDFEESGYAWSITDFS